jgi:MoaA/NifB/PqqE/SkfB family radical SAM enzyme
MYIQITTRCNMKCAHCCNACTKIGKDMSMRTYRKAIEVAKERGDTITLGGGEPTLHRHFWEMIGLALGADCESVWLATNGSQTETALALANMARKGVLGVALSQDDYHDPIDPKVVQAFTKSKSHDFSRTNDNDYREIRNVTSREIHAGRCNWGSETCACEDLVVKPDGSVHVCGCANSPEIGSIFDDNINAEIENILSELGLTSGECANKRDDSRRIAV